MIISSVSSNACSTFFKVRVNSEGKDMEIGSNVVVLTRLGQDGERPPRYRGVAEVVSEIAPSVQKLHRSFLFARKSMHKWCFSCRLPVHT